MAEALGLQGEFNLLHKIGEGGMADVFLAERLGDDGFRTRVALKRLHRGLAMDSYFIRQLVREARLLGQLEHANIVKVFDLRRIGDEYYVVMEYVDGIDLAQVVKVHRNRKTRLPRPFFFHVALSLCEALAYAHNAIDTEGNPTPLIHRDIKPSNVMLSRRGIVKLTDFGIAHVGDGSVTGGLVQGTANYMSPEQAFGEERLAPCSDVYSLGAVFYEMLTGRPLVDGDNYLKAIHQVRERRVTLDELAGLGVEPGLRMVIAKMLSADISSRYQEMESVRNDLQFVADRLKIDLSWHRIRAYVGRLMGILGRAPDRATLSNLQVPEEIRAVAAQLGVGDEAPEGPAGEGPVTPPTPPPVNVRKLDSATPVTHAVQKDMLESALESMAQRAEVEAAAPSDDLTAPAPGRGGGPRPAQLASLATAALPNPASSQEGFRPPAAGGVPPLPPGGVPGGPTVTVPRSELSPGGATTPPTPQVALSGAFSPAASGAMGTPVASPAAWRDQDATQIYGGKSPSEAGVYGTGEMARVRDVVPAPATVAIGPAASGMHALPGGGAGALAPPPAPMASPPPASSLPAVAAASVAAALSGANGDTIPPAPAAARGAGARAAPAYVAARAVGPSAVPTGDEETDSEIWVFSDSQADQIAPIGPAAAAPPPPAPRARPAGARRRKKKRRAASRPVPPLVTTMLVVVILVLLCAVLLVIAIKRDRFGARGGAEALPGSRTEVGSERGIDDGSMLSGRSGLASADSVSSHPRPQSSPA